jgi:DNA-binding transcriptional ArsR family regulator
MTTTKKAFDAQPLIDAQVDQLNEAIEQIDERMKRYDKLQQQRLQLVAARRALLGTGPRLTGGVGTRVTVDDISQYLIAEGGALPSQVAQNFGVTQGTISSHLYRNKGRFVKNSDGKYFVKGHVTEEEDNDYGA